MEKQPLDLIPHHQVDGSKLPDTTPTIDATSLPLAEEAPMPRLGGNFGKLAHLSVWRRILITFSLLLGLLLSIMDTSIVSTSIYTISLEFNSLAKTIWIILAYSLADLGKLPTLLFPALSEASVF